MEQNLVLNFLWNMMISLHTEIHKHIEKLIQNDHGICNCFENACSCYGMVIWLRLFEYELVVYVLKQLCLKSLWIHEGKAFNGNMLLFAKRKEKHGKYSKAGPQKKNRKVVSISIDLQ